jgi:hypothetical protein
VVHRGVGVFQQAVGIGAVVRVDADADAAAAEEFALCHLVGCGHDGAHLFCHLQDLADGGHVADDHHEFVAAQPRHRVFCAGNVAQAPRHL